MLKHLILVSLFVVNCFFAFSQQISSFGNVDVIDSYYNPAFTAFENDVRGAALHRHRQNNSPNLLNDWREFIFLAEMEVQKWNSGIGLKFHQGEDNLSRSRFAEINYRYKLKFNDNTRLSLGVGGGYVDNKLNELVLDMPGVPDDFDVDLKSGININTGVGFSWKESLYLGASVIQWSEPRIGIIDYTRHYTLHGHYLFSISEKTQLQPQVLWLFNNNLNMLRVNLKTYHNERFWWMISSGLNVQFMGAVGLRFWDKLDIGYGIDLYRNPHSKSFGGFLHEVVLSYRLRK